MKKKVICIVCVLCVINVFATRDRWDDYKVDWTPLMCAIYYNQTALRDSLIQAGVDVNEASKWYKITALTVAIRKQDFCSVKALLETDRITDIDGYLFTACAYQDVNIVQLLIEHGAKPDSVWQHGHSPLMSAATYGSIEIVKLLLETKINIDQQRTVDGLTALMLAVSKGHIDKVKLLLEHGADKNILDKNGESAYDSIDYGIHRGFVSEEVAEELRILLK